MSENPKPRIRETRLSELTSEELKKLTNLQERLANLLNEQDIPDSIIFPETPLSTYLAKIIFGAQLSLDLVFKNINIAIQDESARGRLLEKDGEFILVIPRTTLEAIAKGNWQKLAELEFTINHEIQHIEGYYKHPLSFYMIKKVTEKVKAAKIESEQYGRLKQALHRLKPELEYQRDPSENRANTFAEERLTLRATPNQTDPPEVVVYKKHLLDEIERRQRDKEVELMALEVLEGNLEDLKNRSDFIENEIAPHLDKESITKLEKAILEYLLEHKELPSESWINSQT